QSDLAVFDDHFHGEAATDLAVIDGEWANSGSALCDGDMAGAVMAHEDDVVIEIDGIVLRERTAGTKTIQDLHGLGILDFAFAGDWNATGRKQARAENDGADGVFVFGTSHTFVVVGQ